METRPNDISGEKNKARLIDQERSSAESIPSGSSNKQELGKTKGKKRKRSDTNLIVPKAPLPADDRFLNELHENIFPGGPQKSHLEETQKERYTKELDKIRIGKMTPMETLLPGERQRVGKNQTKCKEDALERTLTSYKKNHPSVHDQLSETAKIIRSLRNLLACDSLATEKARAEADSLFNISKSHDEPGGATVADFLVDVDVPELLREVLRSLYQKYPNVFSSKEQTNSEVKCAVDVIYSISRVILNFSDLHGKFCEACGQAGVVQECFKLLEGLKMCTDDFSDTRAILKGPEGTKNRFSRIGSVGFEVLGVSYNLSKSIVNRKYFDTCGAVETLLSFYQTQIPVYRVAALLCLGNLVHEMNNDLIKATEELINDLLTMLKEACNSDDRRYQGYSATAIAQGLIYVASNDGNKKRIGQLGGISVLAAMLKDETNLRERSASVKALYMLSFDKENKDIIKADGGIMDILQSLKHSGDKEIQQAASGVIWEIAGKEEHSTKSSDSQRHIMISYQWDCQGTMLLVKQELESKCFRVWMDVDNMTGDITEAMARAVEKSAIFLMAMSRKYQNSNNCRSEASYAHKLGKHIIPLMMEENYMPDGWLGLILSTKLYMHFEKDPRVGIRQLLKQIALVTAADMD